MPETHLLMQVGGFLGALWWTKGWLMDATRQRWRFILATLSGTIMWVFVAYASTRAVESSSGVQIIYGSMAMAYLSVFLAVVSIAGLVLGLLMWTEESAEEATAELPASMQPGRGD